MNKIPKISVIMSVYNAYEDLEDSIESILEQDFEDFEFLIMDDGSTDNSKKILEKYCNLDKRIRLFENRTNLGLTKSLNILLENSFGQFIARHDSDDLSLKNRFSTQIEFVEKKKFDICVSRAVIKKTSTLIPNLSFFLPTKIVFKFKNPFIHGTLLAKKSVFDDIGGYDENFYYSQDYKFFLDCIKKKNKIKYIKKPLYLLNISNNISARNSVEQKRYAEMVKQEYKIYENIFK